MPDLPPSLATVTAPDAAVTAPVDTSLPAASGTGSSLVTAASATDRAGADSTLMVANAPPTMVAELGKQTDVQLPAGVFASTDASAKIKIEATLSDGQPLPTWLKFDAATGKFSGVAPKDSSGSLDIKVSANDESGNSAEVQFKMVIADTTGGTSVSVNPAQAAPAAKGATVAGDSPISSVSTVPGATAVAPSAPATSPEAAGTGAATGSANPLVATVSADAAPAGMTLFVAEQPPPTETNTGKALAYQLPSGLFRHTDAAATTSTEATQSDGKPLPAWLKYDSATGKFSGTAPAGAAGVVEIKVIARDNKGREASAQFKIQITEAGEQEQDQPGQAEGKGEPAAGAAPDKGSQRKDAAAGKASLSNQLAQFGRKAGERERAELIKNLKMTTQRAKVAA